MTEAEARQRIAEIERRIGYNNRTMAGCTDTPCKGCDAMKAGNARHEAERRDLRAYLDSLKGEIA